MKYRIVTTVIENSGNELYLIADFADLATVMLDAGETLHVYIRKYENCFIHLEVHDVESSSVLLEMDSNGLYGMT